jgi:hypothetical protein
MHKAIVACASKELHPIAFHLSNGITLKPISSSLVFSFAFNFFTAHIKSSLGLEEVTYTNLVASELRSSSHSF